MENVKVIVSLTSHTKERLANVPYFLYHSIFKNNYDYVKVVLTLYKEDVPNMPPKLKEMIDLGLVELIVAEENLRCHLKYFYAMKKYRDLPVITIDDDSIYPKEMIPDFLKNAEKYPNTIIARSYILEMNENFIKQYEKEHEMKVTFDGAESEEGEQVFTLPDQLDELIENVHNYAVHNCDFYVNGKSYCGI